jgi:hypothetical protein
MRSIAAPVVWLSVIFLAAGVHAADPQETDWTRQLADRAKRGTLHDQLQVVRGDSGKWNDEARLQHAPAIQHKPGNLSLDDWADQLLEQEVQLASDQNSWLLFRTRQLDDNDRVWVERIERRGNQLTVILHEAVWAGAYQKNFTYYSVIGVNVGQLQPGSYEAKWVIQPYRFTKLEPAQQAQDRWPADERPAQQEAHELSVSFTVSPAP